MDMGLDAYAVDNLNTFPILSNGDPDFSHRREPERKDMDETQIVYSAWNQLVTNQNLSAEERYGYRRDVFTNLPEMNWQEFTQLGGSTDPVTAEAFADWLRDQESFSEGEIYYIQRGSMDTGLDGFYAENYCSVLAAALAYDPVAFARQLAYDGSGTDESQLRAHVLTDAAYGIDYTPARASAAVEKLDAAIGTNALTEEENAWARLLRYYLANPNNGDYSDYPKTPEELPA